MNVLANDGISQDKLVIKLVNQSIINVESHLNNFKFRDACSEFMNIARIGNKYLADEEPWKKIKDDPSNQKGLIKPAVRNM